MNEEKFVEDDALEPNEDDTLDVVNGLQDEVAELTGKLVEASARILELEGRVRGVAPAGDDVLRGLAATVRQCQRTGHPHLGEHLEALLTALGA